MALFLRVLMTGMVCGLNLAVSRLAEVKGGGEGSEVRTNRAPVKEVYCLRLVVLAEWSRLQRLIGSEAGTRFV